MIKDFTDLNTWKEGHKLVLFTYRICKLFPKEELFALASQMKRASTSVTSNLAEGFGRKSYKEKVQFYYLSNGSLVELKNQLIIARDVGYIDKPLFMEGLKQVNLTQQLLQGLITKSKSFLPNHNS